MLVKFFNHGTKASGNTTANSVKNYLLNERVKDGTAKIIRGDEPLTSATIDRSEYPSTYTAGCLSFDKKESLTDEQKQELMQSFEQALLPNFDPTRYACYWVEHSDKERLELNFVFARIDLATGKNLNVYYHRRDEKRLNNWKEIQIQKYDLEDPNDPMHEQEIKPFYSRRANGSMIGDSLASLKYGLHNIIKYKIDTGKIHNRQGVIDLITSLKDEKSQAPLYEIAKETKTSITVKWLAKGETFRLKGSFYARDFMLEPQGTDNAKSPVISDRKQRHSEYVANKAERLANAVDWYARLCKHRADELNKKHGKQPHGTRPSTNLAPQPPQPTENFNHVSPRKSPNARERTERPITERADTDRYPSTNRPHESEIRPITGENRAIVSSPLQLFRQCRKLVDEVFGTIGAIRNRLENGYNQARARLSSRIERIRERINHRDTQEQKRLEECQRRNKDLAERIDKAQRPFAEVPSFRSAEVVSDIEHDNNRTQASESELRASQDWLREYNQNAERDDKNAKSGLGNQKRADFDLARDFKRLSKASDTAERRLRLAKQADTAIREKAKEFGYLADDTPILQLVPIVKQELKRKEQRYNIPQQEPYSYPSPF